MSIKDIIKSSVYNSFVGNTDLSVKTIMLTLLISIVMGVYIFLVYKFLSKQAFYSRDINTTMACLPLVVAAIMLAMQSNLIVSLGMVGALSIVRFRNALKNPLDLLYVFWAVSVGIICGVGLYMLSIMLCVALTLLLVVLQCIPTTKAPSVLVLRAGSEGVDWDAVENVISDNAKYSKQKSKNVQGERVEVIYEIAPTRKGENHLVDELKKIDNLKEISLLKHDGEFRL